MHPLRTHIQQVTPLSDKEFAQVQGIYKVFYTDEAGKEHVVQFAQENWWMTDY